MNIFTNLHKKNIFSGIAFIFIVFFTMPILNAAERYFVPPAKDRAFWDKYKNQSGYIGNATKRAQKVWSKNIPPMPNPQNYITPDKSKGEAGTYMYQLNLFTKALQELLWGYCITADRTLLPPIEKMLNDACEMQCWTNPAHDPEYRTFYGKTFQLELYSTTIAGWLGATCYLLQDELKPEIRNRVVAEIDRRILCPFETELKKPVKKRTGWIDYPGNWNAVCLAGISIAASTTVEDPKRLDALLNAAKIYSKSYLDGYTSDGYTSEGVDYWNYGFGHYLQLVKILRLTSNGKTDLLSDPKTLKALQFPDNICIDGEIYPSYADSQIYSKCDPRLISWRNALLGKHSADAKQELTVMHGHLVVTTMEKVKKTKLAPISSYPEAGVYNFRPGETNSRLAFSIKGGHNYEGHNHNDVGSYSIVIDKKYPIVCDPGAEEYTKRTFSDKRYDSKLLNSYGHCVPVAAGLLQGYGRQYCGKLLKESHSDQVETLLWDLAAAYPPAAGIEKLTREIIYNRTGAGSISVSDAVEFARPAAFATAVVTPGKLSCDGKLWKITYREKQLTLKISAVGGDIVCRAEEIKEKARSKEKVSRLEISFTQPVKKGEIRVEYLP